MHLKILPGKIKSAQFDSSTTAKLQQRLRGRVGKSSPEITLLLEQLHEFAWQTHCEGFQSTLTKRLKISVEAMPPIPVVIQLIAEFLCGGMPTRDRAIAVKSLQETLYLCTGIEPNLSLSEFENRFEDHLESSGSKGLIRTFLTVHLSNLIYMDLDDSVRIPAREVFGSRTEGIERLSQIAAGRSVRSWPKWPKLTHTIISSVITSAADMASGQITKLV